MTRIALIVMVCLTGAFLAACNQYGVEAACPELTVDACAQREDCTTISGRKGDVENGCLQAASGVGCRDKETGCYQAETFAVDPDGECYLFADSCVPDGWTIASGQTPCRSETFPSPDVCPTTNPNGICIENGAFVHDLSRLESGMATQLLAEAYAEKSDEKLVEFLDNWAGTIGPITCELFDQKSDMERESYYLYQDYYNPFNLAQYGQIEWGEEIYAEFEYVVAQDRFVAETNAEDRQTFELFRPVIHFDNAKVLYLTEGYRTILDEFLGGDPGQEDVWERYEFLRTRLPVLPGHWGGWHFVTHPEVGLAEFEPDLQGALVYFRIVYEGGESTLVKQDDEWKLTESRLTWIE